MGQAASVPIRTEAGGADRWPPLSPGERRWILATMALVFGIALTRLPLGPCFGDPGDFQTSCAALGIAHPPGYVGYVGIGWLITKLFFFLNPAYVVSLACAACVVASLGLLIKLLVRIGLHVLMACSIALALLAHHTPWQSSVWQSLVCPEIYGASWLVLIGSVTLLLRYGRLRRRRDLYIAAALYGFLVVNRTSSIMFAPAYLLAWALIEWRSGMAFRAAAMRLGGLTLSFTASGLAVTVATIALDHPSTEYNTIELHREGYVSEVPAWRTDLGRRLVRFHWLMSGAAFHELVVPDFAHARSKSRWIRRVLFVFETERFAAATAVILLGLVLLARNGLEWALIPLGVIIGNVVFLYLYNVHDQAANLLPLMFAAAMCVGAVLARLFPTGGARREMAWVVFAFACAGNIYFATQRYNYAKTFDATDYLAETQLVNFPKDAVILTNTHIGCALLYDRNVVSRRFDVKIIESNMNRWYVLTLEHLDRPFFCTDERARTPGGYRLVPFRNMWQLVRN